MKHSAFEKIARFGRDRTTLLIVVLAGLGTAHLLVRTAPYGTAVDPDSTFFLSTALNFLAGEGWRDFTGEPLTLWPPLFPLLLVAGGWVGIEPLEAGRWINATAFGLTILAAGCWLRSNLQSRWLTLTATAIIAASRPLSDLASRFMTEPLFVLFTLLALMQLAAFLNRRTDAPLWWAAVFTALAAITRYAGVVLIGVGVLVLLVRRAPPLAARLKHAIVRFGAVSSIPLAGVLTRNWAVSGTLTGPNRSEMRESLSDWLSQMADGFRGWVIPPNAPDGLGYLLWMVAGLVVLAAGAVVVWSGRSVGRGGKSPSFGLGPVLPFGVFAVAYLVFMVTIVPLVSPVSEFPFRYLVPVYVPLLLVAVFLLDRFLSISATGWMGAVRYGLASLVLLGALAHIGFSAYANLGRTARAYVTGYRYGSYNAPHWQHSETLNYVRDNHIEGRIYSNIEKLAWFWDRTAAVRKVRTYRYIIPNKMGWDAIEAGAHIVWLDVPHSREHRGYDDLDVRLLPGIEVVAELADGLVLRRTAYEPFDAKRHHARKQRYVNQLIQQADEQVVRAGWTVYRTGRTLIYRKKPCVPADTQAKFVLHVVPADPADLPAHRQQYGFDNLGFYFHYNLLYKSLGFRLGDQCIAIAQLPAYAIDRIHIGQWISRDNRTLWAAELTPSR